MIGPYITTPYGTGGGVWESAAGLASDGTYIYFPTGNGTFDAAIPYPRSVDYGDSIIKLNASNLSVVDHFTPTDVLNYNGDGRCAEDKDLGSGGILIFPHPFFTGHDRMMVSGDKESKLYVLDRDALGGYMPPPGTDHIVQGTTTPPITNVDQGYWSTPAYWEWTSGGATTRALYYSPSIDNDSGLYTPLSIDQYILNPNISIGPPIPGGFRQTSTLFCGHGATPSISASGSTPGTGLLWAIEVSNGHNQSGQQNPDCHGNWGAAVLHAYDATTLAEKYTSSQGHPQTSVGSPTQFSTPTIFNGKVYMGTWTEVDVFGPCGSPTTPCMP